MCAKPAGDHLRTFAIGYVGSSPSSPEVDSLFPVEIIIVPALIAGTVAMFRMWLGHKEKRARTVAPDARDPVLDERLMRIEQAVEAIALEMERVGEGQRFVTRLLSERATPSTQPSALPPTRENTPH